VTISSPCRNFHLGWRRHGNAGGQGRPGDGRVTGDRPGDRAAAGRQDEAAAKAAAGEVAEAGGRALAVQADQGSLDDLRRLTGQAQEYLDGLDIVVINAAGGLPGLIREVTEDDYDRFMAVHAKGPFFLIQHAGRALRDGGRIIAISTLNTRLHPPGETMFAVMPRPPNSSAATLVKFSSAPLAPV
jgi:NAD(P)-dependent dehydrogenase (short-subunit alcohol dehydrogenase family)